MLRKYQSFIVFKSMEKYQVKCLTFKNKSKCNENFMAKDRTAIN